MNILMLLEYYPPFDIGGSEWSSYYLAKELVEKNITVTILTPNFGNAPKKEEIEGITVIRFPFLVKMKNKNPVTPYWFTNNIWKIISIFYIWKVCLEQKIDVIHIQGKYFLPAAVIVKWFLRVKTVITLRDYIVLCPLGMCFMNSHKSCNFKQFLFKDLPIYLKEYYGTSNLFIKILIVIASLRLWLVSKSLKFLLQFIDQKVAISNVVRSIYKTNGIVDIDVIYNPMQITISSKKNLTQKNQLLYIGRLTPGKGIVVLITAFANLYKKHKGLKLIVIGKGFLESKLKQIAKDKELDISFRGFVPHQEVQEIIRESKIVVTPSIWPEPFGRVPMESIALGVPVVVSKTSGVAEVINDNWGIKVEPQEKALEAGITTVLLNNQLLRNNIRNAKDDFLKEYQNRIITNYLNIYKRLV